MIIIPLLLGLPLIAALVFLVIALMLDKDRICWLKEHGVDLEIGALNIEDLYKLEVSKLNVLRSLILKFASLMSISMITAMLIFSALLWEEIFHLSTYLSPHYIVYILIQLAITITCFVAMYRKSIDFKTN